MDGSLWMLTGKRQDLTALDFGMQWKEQDMAKRMTKAEATGIFWLIIIGIPIYGFVKLQEAIGMEGIWIGVAVIVGGYLLYRFVKHRAEKARRIAEEREYLRQIEARRTELMEKYGDEKIVAAIMNRSYWQGQTAEQLKDSLGRPVDVDERVMKTARKEVWKYHQTAANRFGLRITLEDGLVVGWDEKM